MPLEPDRLKKALLQGDLSAEPEWVRQELRLGRLMPPDPVTHPTLKMGFGAPNPMGDALGCGFRYGDPQGDGIGAPALYVNLLGTGADGYGCGMLVPGGGKPNGDGGTFEGHVFGVNQW